MKCKVCNTVNPDNAQYCRQCGTLLNPSLENGLSAYSDPKSNCNVMSIIGLVTSLVSICLFFMPYQWIISIAALIMCIIARIQLSFDGKKGKDLALAGIILSILGGLVNALIYNGWYLNLQYILGR